MAILDRILDRESGRERGRDTIIGPDTTYDILKNERRRKIIRALIDDFDDTCSLRDLAEFIAATEHPSATPQTIGGQDRKRVYVSLYQTHVPRMAEEGVIMYDQDAPLAEEEIEATVETKTLYDILDQNEAVLGGGA